MKEATRDVDARLGRRLILDELFDLSLYRALRAVAPPELRRTLDALIPVETRHFAFWQEFFGAGALSMAAGAYVATSSEAEVRETEAARRRFLGEAASDDEDRASALGAAILVGASYFAGALVPVLPVLFGARTAWVSLFMAGTMIIVVSTLLAFLSGMDVRRRIVTNLVIIAAAVGITYMIGIAAKALFGIAV